MITSSRPLHVTAIGRVVPAQEPDWNAGISPGDKRRSPRIWQMASIAAARALEGQPQPRALLTATALGALDETRAFLQKVFVDGLGSPRNFIASVHNSMGGKLAQDHDIRGPNLTLCDGQNSLASAIVAADLLADEDFPALIVAVDENIQLLEDLLPFFSPQCRAHVQAGWNDAAVALLCTRQSEVSMGTVAAYGPVVAAAEDAQSVRDQFAASLPDSTRLLDLGDTCASFIHPALAVHDLLAGGKAGRAAVPSHAPTSGATAAVEVCI
jgi:hypothetical protein